MAFRAARQMLPRGSGYSLRLRHVGRRAEADFRRAVPAAGARHADRPPISSRTNRRPSGYISGRQGRIEPGDQAMTQRSRQDFLRIGLSGAVLDYPVPPEALRLLLAGA